MSDRSLQSRVGTPDPATMSERQRRQYAEMQAGPYGAYGPRMLLIHDPDLYDAWVHISGALLRNDVGERYRKLAILVIARHWKAQFEWYAHADAAIGAGVDRGAVEAIREGRAPISLEPDEKAIYDYTRELCCDRAVGDDSYAAARAVLGDAGLVQLTVFIGQYTNVAMMLVAHRLGLPEGEDDRLHDLPGAS